MDILAAKTDIFIPLQLKVSGRTDGAETTVIWSLTREKRN
jgi:hypothetical protein